MQVFKSQYGRKGIRVSDLCPTRSIRAWLGRTHVSTTTEDVEKIVRACAKGDKRWTEKLRVEAVRFAVWQHEENLAEYTFVMGNRPEGWEEAVSIAYKRSERKGVN